MQTLIIKLGATGDVVRTTPLLSRLGGHVTWLTEAKNTVLLEGLKENLRCVSWRQRQILLSTKYDLIINLEDSLEVGGFLKTLEVERLWGRTPTRRIGCATPMTLSNGLI